MVVVVMVVVVVVGVGGGGGGGGGVSRQSYLHYVYHCSHIYTRILDQLTCIHHFIMAFIRIMQAFIMRLSPVCGGGGGGCWGGGGGYATK